jgi:LacI family transcriptional regulator
MARANGRITLADVALAARVDVSLVSRVLRGQGIGERPETAERIRQCAAALGYRPNAVARSLRTARAGAYGLVIPDFTNPVYAEIITGAEAAAAEIGCVMLTGSGAGWDRGDWHSALSGGRIDGLLVAGGSRVDLDEIDVPYLLVNRAHPTAKRYIVLADEEAAGLAVEHLAMLGHRRIAFLCGPDGADTAQRRLAGYRAAVNRLQLDADPQLEMAADYSASGGAEATRRLLAAGIPFTGMVAANLTAALGARRALHAAGRAIPRDVSMVAIHDADLAAYLEPPLTTVRMPLAELGARAIRLVANTEPDEPVREVVSEPMTLVIRESTAAAPASA